MQPPINFHQVQLNSDALETVQTAFRALITNPTLFNLTSLKSTTDKLITQQVNNQQPAQIPSPHKRPPAQTETRKYVPQPTQQHRESLASSALSVTAVTESQVLATSTTPAPIRKCHCRRRNIIIHGLKPSKPNPTNMDLKTDAKSFLFTKLNLSIEPQSVHLIGSGDSKPFRVRFRTVQDKKKVLGNCHLLKPYRWEFRVTNDLPYEQRQIMKLLQHRLNIQKKKGNRVRIKDFVLYINGVPDFDAETIYNETPTAEPSQHATSPSTSFLLPSLPPPTPPRTKRRAPGPPTSTTN